MMVKPLTIHCRNDTQKQFNLVRITYPSEIERSFHVTGFDPQRSAEAVVACLRQELIEVPYPDHVRVKDWLIV